MAEATPSLRELNKRRTREAISHAATRLFIDRGFDRTTIAEVAVAAGVAKMTVTNHFPRKEDLVLDMHQELVAGPARTVAERAPGESALAALAREFLAALERRDAALGFSGPEFVGMITGSPALAARLREIHEQREAALAAVLEQETGDGLGARLAAGQLDAVHRVLFSEVCRRTLAGADNPTIAAELAGPARRGFAQLEPVLGEYAVRAGEA